uniref:M3 family metallopeptidase n=1 Tax=Pararhizobium sp. IMCC3301 TaxID=3067904 RepID=UPI002740511B|nr:M3 family metallopeptidase [Pararhizobium sp. IMCC3301]
MSDNPLLAKWSTPFEIPPFGQIKTAHFNDGFDRAMVSNRAEIDAIADNPDAPTFDNTIVELEKSGDKLDKVASTFFNLTGANTNDALQKIEREIAPRLSRHSSATVMNARLFGRIKTLFDAIESLALGSEESRVLSKYYESFVRSGAALTGNDRERMSEISARLSELGTQFSQNVLADEKAYQLVLEDESDLAGLPDFLISAARSAAQERGLEGKHVITLSRSLIEPFLQFSSRRDLRETAFKAWTSRGENGNDSDNRAIISEILQLRDERARLLGFDGFAHFKLDNQMAKTPDAVRDLLENVWTPAKARAEKEAVALSDLARGLGDNAQIAPWDWRYYSQKLRMRDHALDEAEIKPYFQLDNMIEAAFAAANRLFGVWFREVTDLQLYHPDVRAWEVRDAAGHHVGLFLGDYFARSSKRSGAWMSAFRSQEKLSGDIRPIIVNVMNFAKAPAGEPNLLTFDDAHTLFHEFGHALHGLLSDVNYPLLSGTSVARDFVELPSQLFEHWLTTPEILTKYARHARTGEPLPQVLMQRLLAARTFNQGFSTVEYVSSALVDLEMHLNAQEAAADPLAFEARTLDRIGMPKQITMRHRSPHFMHIFSGDGYSSGYYSYLWSEVMDADAFVAFEEAGDAFDAGLASKLKQHIYSAGNSADPAELYTRFRGRMPAIDALLEKRGLQSAASTG